MSLANRWTELDDDQRFAVMMLVLSVAIFLAVRRADGNASR